MTTLGVIGRNGTPYILARPKSAVHTRTHTHTNRREIKLLAIALFAIAPIFQKTG